MPTNTRSTFGKATMFAPDSPSIWQHLQRNPLLFISQWLYAHRPPIATPRPTATPVKVVCISDTHNEQPQVPNGEMLIHAGDMTVNGTFAEMQLQLTWLNSLPHHHKIVVAGNHDLLLDQSFFHSNPQLASSDSNDGKRQDLEWGTLIYLEYESRVLDVRNRTLRVHGSPMTPQYGNWAFQYPKNEDGWINAPEAIDILVTHGPARGHLDSSPLDSTYLQGCAHL